MENKNSVIIIGAGLAGLTAADEILTQKPGTQVVLIEAMDQAGGRTRSVEINGATYDLGAQWIGNTQKYVETLA